MLTNKRKLRNRKQLFIKLFVFVALFCFTLVAGYLVSLKLFVKQGYLSPLAKGEITDVSSDEEKAIALISKKLAEQKIAAQSVSHQGTGYKIVLQDNAEVTLSSEKDLSTQISSLQFILQRLTMEGRRFSRLDLTFDKPVIVLEK